MRFLTPLEKTEARLTALQYVCAARKKWKLFKRSQGDRRAGAIVLFDRYPLEAFQTFPDPMDGPKIATALPGEKGRFLGWCAEREERYHKRIKPPDRLVLLEADWETVSKRKTENIPNEAAIRNKIRMVDSLKDSPYPITRIDASHPLDEVRLRIKKSFWQWL